MQLESDVVICPSFWLPPLPLAELARDTARTGAVPGESVCQTAAAYTRRVAAEGAVGERQRAPVVGCAAAVAAGEVAADRAVGHREVAAKDQQAGAVGGRIAANRAAGHRERAGIDQAAALDSCVARDGDASQRGIAGVVKAAAN